VSLYGGIETGGTTWKCAIGTGPDDLRSEAAFSTTAPAETIDRAAVFFESSEPVAALGIGSFGPVDLRAGSPTWGHVTTTPKPGWANADVAGALGRRLGVPVAFDTDVNAAALGEHRWGAAQGLDTFVYLTVGTGIGGGVMASGRLVHGLAHPEFGHLLVPHDLDTDPFPGFCPYHGDCWEGLAAGPAIEARWGKPAEQLLDVAEVWELEARYVALGLVCVIAILSPQLVVLGGGVGGAPPLLPLVRRDVAELISGYVQAPDIVPPGLRDRSGVLGAIALAQAL
jgi:fructokinase